MARTLSIGRRTGFRLCVLLAVIGPAIHPLRAQAPPPSPAQEQEPPEEDATLKPKEYVFNPLQAQKELTAGNFYYKKGNYRAAAKRYREASLWDPSAAEAFFKLGESSEKLRDYSSALEAYTKYLELDKNAKDADALRKRIAKWPTPKDDPAAPSGSPKK